MPLTSSYTEAVLVTPVEGQPGDVHDTAKNEINAVAYDQFGNEYRYGQGVANAVEGSAVTFDELGVTALLAANAKGPVMWATGAIVAAKFGWFARFGNLLGRVVTNTADNSLLGRESADGDIGDGRAAGDQIYGVVARAANASGATVLQKIQTACYPFVDDIYGS